MIIAFLKDDDEFIYRVKTDTLKYNGFKLLYGFSFGLKKVTQILSEIEKHVPLKMGLYHPVETYLSISPGILLDPMDEGRAYKEVNNEKETIEMTNDLKHFYTMEFVPFFDKYSNIEKLDSIINDLDDFWEDSNPNLHFPVIPYFHIIRLIYARLNNNSNYEEIVVRNFDGFEKVWKDMGGTFDRNDDKKFPQVFAAKYLRNMKF